MKILAIGAHQDDNEFRVGGMAHKWVQKGKSTSTRTTTYKYV